LKTKFFILMGVSGSGKTTIGRALAEKLGWDFYDADDFHPPENIAKMARGIPLNDDDRAPWLTSLHTLISACLKENRPGVLACSGLKERYRQLLLAENQGVQIVFLKGDYDLIWSRMIARPGHYMKPELLKSQFDALDEPTDGLVINVSLTVEEIVNKILEYSTLSKMGMDCG
jgi:gluconokinase